MAVLIPVPYLSQRDNKVLPSRTCAPTSVAMVLATWSARPEMAVYRSRPSPDEITQFLQSFDMWKYAEEKCSDLLGNGITVRNIHSCLKQTMRSFGISSSDFKYPGLKLEDFKPYLDAGCPLIISTTFPWLSGHVVVCVGYQDDGSFITHDPYGDFNVRHKPGSCGRYVSVPLVTAQQYFTSGVFKWAHVSDLKWPETVLTKFSLAEISKGEALADFAKRLGVKPTAVLAANGLTTDLHPWFTAEGWRFVIPREDVPREYGLRL